MTSRVRVGFATAVWGEGDGCGWRVGQPAGGRRAVGGLPTAGCGTDIQGELSAGTKCSQTPSGWRTGLGMILRL